ncbi:hypothetical protein SeMB42_g00363 [Synchytrium endobioticum]|uniref:Major facilitator superfamily (MFS) profile domain-containing protein n=1 Tax=Synchytrium endobioticum TaxID=286115 RepID=A0A507DRV3_9FUNG|nr:hypothetical protein SeMB42_g00363 [Synchytrium endobioticum]
MSQNYPNHTSRSVDDHDLPILPPSSVHVDSHPSSMAADNSTAHPIIINTGDKVVDISQFQISTSSPIIGVRSGNEKDGMAAAYDDDDDDEELRLQEAKLNEDLDGKILKHSSRMPWSIYFIVPNEFSERFCFYGIMPLLNTFFKRYLSQGSEKAIMIVSLFKALAYITPLFGSAISDSYLAKYTTIVTLSCVYALGTVLLSIFSTPSIMGYPLQSWPVVLALVLIACGTGGIKPCVCSHGGDQFPASMPHMLNRFYNIFYMSINAGALIAGYVTPTIAERSCYGSENCYTWAFGLCAIVMIFAVVLFAVGHPWYRIVPPFRKFIPFEMMKMVIKAAYRNFKTGRLRAHGTSFFDSVSGAYPTWFIRESKDLMIVFGLITPTLLFWTGFDQKDSTWQNTYEQMNPNWGGIHIDAAMNGNLNPIFIVLLTPVFSYVVYPWIEKKRGGNFKLLDRMIYGMLLAAIAFIIVALIQLGIDSNPDALIYDAKAGQYICNPANYGACLHGAWLVIPFFIITCAELMFAISGLNLVYEEVGKRMTSLGAALWLLMSALGNLIAAALAPAYVMMGAAKFYFLTAGIIIGALVFYSALSTRYIYRKDRKHHPKNAVTSMIS